MGVGFAGDGAGSLNIGVAFHPNNYPPDFYHPGGGGNGPYNCSSSIELHRQASQYHDYCISDVHVHGSSDNINTVNRSLPNVDAPDYCFDLLKNVLSVGF